MTKKLLFKTFLFFTIFFTPVLSKAEEPIYWGEFDGWSVLSLPAFDYGCTIRSSFYADGTLLFFGFDRREGNIYLSILNRDWASLKDGDLYKMIINYKPKGIWEGTAEVYNLDGDIGQLVMTVNDSDALDFVQEFALKEAIKFTINQYELANLSLKGSNNAVLELIKCQDAVNNYVANNDITPFMSKFKLKKITPKDPFTKIKPIN